MSEVRAHTSQSRGSFADGIFPMPEELDLEEKRPKPWFCFEALDEAKEATKGRAFPSMTE